MRELLVAMVLSLMAAVAGVIALDLVLQPNPIPVGIAIASGVAILASAVASLLAFRGYCRLKNLPNR